MKLALVALVAGGIVLASPTVAPTDALTLSGLTISDASKTVGPNGEVTGVTVDVSGEYEYQSTHELGRVELILYAAPTDGSFAPVDTLTLDTPGTNGSGTAALSGDLTALDGFTVADFDAAQGQTTTKHIDFKLVAKLYRDGTRVGVADASDSAVVSVTREQMTVSAQVAGDGSVVVLTA